MIYGIALCTYEADGQYNWSLLDGQIFRSRDEAIEHGRRYAEDRNWNGMTTFEDSYSWNWRREDNAGEMDDLCLVADEDRAGVVREIRQLG